MKVRPHVPLVPSSPPRTVSDVLGATVSGHVGPPPTGTPSSACRIAPLPLGITRCEDQGQASCSRGLIMRAIWTTGTNGPDSLEVRETEDPEPAPEPGSGIRVRAAGLCFAEVMAAQGLYPDAPEFFPPCSATRRGGVWIEQAVGEGVDERRDGSHVIALTRYGAHSDAVCVPANQAFAIPPHKDFTEAAAIPVNYLTAYHILFRAATIRPGERVLVLHGRWRPRHGRRSSCAARGRRRGDVRHRVGRQARRAARGRLHAPHRLPHHGLRQGDQATDQRRRRRRGPRPPGRRGLAEGPETAPPLRPAWSLTGSPTWRAASAATPPASWRRRRRCRC